MGIVLFYIVMVLVGSAYAIIFCNPTEDATDAPFAARYPVLGVFALLGLLSAVYWLLIMAEKNILSTFSGCLVLLLSYEFSLFGYQYIKRKK